MESDSDDSNQTTSFKQNNCPFKLHTTSLVAQRDISAYMQHITDVCDPPAYPDLSSGKAISAQYLAT